MRQTEPEAVATTSTSLKTPALIRPVIMSGGAGTRLWPLSTRAAPKQFHALGGAQSLFTAAAQRVAGPQFAAPIILANVDHAGLIRESLAEAGLAAALLILEPEPRNTAPAIAAAALAAAPDDILAVLPADHAIPDGPAFAAALLGAAEAAAAGRIVTFGLKPTRPETGFGYIKSAENTGAVRKVERFVEKPDLETAERYLASGDYFWNAGIFLFRARTMLDEMRKHCPATVEAAQAAISRGALNGTELRLDAEAFARTHAQSIDYEIMEKTDRASVAPMAIDWSDIGSWAALWEIADKDENGNAATAEEAVLIDAAGNIAVSTGPAIALVGVDNLVVVATKDGVLVMPKERAQDVKRVVEALKARGRSDLL